MAEYLDNVIKQLLDGYQKHAIMSKIDSQAQPNREIIKKIIENLQKVIFPGFFESKSLKSGTISYYVGSLLEEVEYHLQKQIIRAYRCCGKDSHDFEELSQLAKDKCVQFMERLPEVQAILETDVAAAFDGDPAAYSMDEIIYSYPGLHAIMVYRIAHILYELQVPLIPRIMSEGAHGATGIDIHPGAQIGKYFFIDHGTGIVIGETTIIGENVKIYQGVTLGGLSTSGGQQLKGKKRHPTIEDNVTIYSGASILGGNTVIGKGSLIGGNSFVTESVPPNTRVVAMLESKVLIHRAEKSGE